MGRVVFVQYGDHRAGVENFARGGEETYAAQRYSIDLVTELSRKHEFVSVICVNADPYEEELANGVRVQAGSIPERNCWKAATALPCRMEAA